MHAPPEVIKGLLGRTYFHADRGEAEEAFVFAEELLKVCPIPDIYSHKIFLLDFVNVADVKAQQKVRRSWWDAIGSKEPRCDSPMRDMNPARKLVIGYVSGDFRHHSAATCFGPVIATHDRKLFDVVCYSNEKWQDQTTQWFKEKARFVDVARFSEKALCEQIERDKIDILVDLSGHTQQNRLAVFARKPAPIQVTAWGHITGTGLPTMDYIFADPVLIPMEHRPFFAEKVYDLPCALMSEPPPLDIVDPPVLRRGYVTFGSFNRPPKLTRPTLALWEKILKTVPDSRLVIKTGGFDERKKRDEFRAKFKHIDPRRVWFMRDTLSGEHIKAAQDHVDIMLDPLPQNGGVSSWESLYCGIPLVTLEGKTPCGRLGASILTAIGKPEWIAHSGDEYVEIAAGLAANRDNLTSLRRTLAADIRLTESGDVGRYTKAVESAYRDMWVHYCAMQNAA